MAGPYFPDPAAEALRDTGFDATAFVADANGNVIELVKYLIANPAVGFTWRNQGLQGSSNSNPVAGFNNPLTIRGLGFDGVSILGNGAGTPTTSGTTAVYDTTNNRWYLRNNTGSQGNVEDPPSVVRLHPYGPSGFADYGYDLDNGAFNNIVRPSDIDCFVLEMEGTWTAAVAASDATGMGISSIGFTNTTIFATTSKAIGFYRKSGGSGWTIKGADGAAQSETSEAADTSDGNKHFFRLEWHGKATPEARLYVDGVLKVTKTTNLPALSNAAPPNHLGMGVAAALGDDTARWYSHCFYWKNAA